MTLRLNGATSGFTEIDSPAIGGSNTLLLPGSNGSAYQFLRNGATAGTTEFAAAITSGTAVASTSGTSIDFTGIPSYVKRITVMFSGVSTSGTSYWQIRLGTSGGIEATGYSSASMYCSTSGLNAVNSTTGFQFYTIGASYNYNGSMTITNLTSNTWTENGIVANTTGGDFVFYSAGAKTLSGTLDRVRITTVNGSDTFDAGSINILYEG